MYNCGVYIIENTTNGKIYVGSSSNIKSRFSKHKKELQQGIHHSKILQRSWDKYGGDKFIFKKILVCAKENLLVYEQIFLDNLKPFYNICKLARSILGMKRKPFSEEHRAKLRLAHKNRVYTKRTQEQCKRISEAQTGLIRGPMSERHKAAISASNKKIIKTKVWQDNINKVIRSKEHRDKLSKIVLARNSPSYRAKLSNSAKVAWVLRRRKL